MHFLSQYLPHLAPVELIFGAIKNKIRRMKHCTIVDFGKQQGKITTIRMLETIKRTAIVNFLRKFIAETKKAILEAFQS